MSVIQVAYDVPDEYSGLFTGEMSRFGSVVRDHDGIIGHLKEVPLPDDDNDTDNSNALIYAAIGLGLIAVTGAVIWAVNKFKKNKKTTLPERPKCVEDYNKSLCAYLEAVRGGTLDLDTINGLIRDLEALKENYDGGNITIEFRAEQLDALLNLVFDYTKQLAAVNSVELDDIAAPDMAGGGDVIINLRHYLDVQKQIFEKAA